MELKKPGIGDAFLRMGLRMIPLLPAPELYDLIRSVTRSQVDVDKQVSEAVDALTRSSELIDNLGVTLKEREEKLKALRIEYARVSQLASLTKEQGEAVATSLEKALGKTQGRERIVSFTINIIAGGIIFVVGVFAADWIKALPGRIF
jgi:hypothetical protein